MSEFCMLHAHAIIFQVNEMLVDIEGVCQRVEDTLAHAIYLPDGRQVQPSHYQFLGVCICSHCECF